MHAHFLPCTEFSLQLTSRYCLSLSLPPLFPSYETLRAKRHFHVSSPSRTDDAPRCRTECLNALIPNNRGNQLLTLNYAPANGETARHFSFRTAELSLSADESSLTTFAFLSLRSLLPRGFLSASKNYVGRRLRRKRDTRRDDLIPFPDGSPAEKITPPPPPLPRETPPIYTRSMRARVFPGGAAQRTSEINQTGLLRATGFDCLASLIVLQKYSPTPYRKPAGRINPRCVIVSMSRQTSWRSKCRRRPLTSLADMRVVCRILHSTKAAEITHPLRPPPAKYANDRRKHNSRDAELFSARARARDNPKCSGRVMNLTAFVSRPESCVQYLTSSTGSAPTILHSPATMTWPSACPASDGFNCATGNKLPVFSIKPVFHPSSRLPSSIVPETV